MNRLLFATVVLFVCTSSLYAEVERLWWDDATINGKPVQFVLDTGTGPSVVLYSPAARRLGLKVTPPKSQPDPGQVAAGTTELCDLDLGTTKARTSLYVVEIPAYLNQGLPGDGLLGWRLIKKNVFMLDAVKHKLKLCKVPKDTTAWTKFCLQTNSDVLDIEVLGQKGAKATVSIDTGSPYGVGLNPQMWREWKAIHTNQPTTINAYYTPAIGFVVKEEAWTHEISLGPLVLTDIPVTEADSSEVVSHASQQTQYEATLGLAALKRLDIIIDGKHGLAYLRSKKTPPLPYQHNRLGADFIPQDSHNDDLIAHVAKGSPAAEAGIRDGDILLKENKWDVTKWRTDTNPPPEIRPVQQPAGTKLELTLKRGDKVFTTTAVLRNILPPDPPKNSN